MIEYLPLIQTAAIGVAGTLMTGITAKAYFKLGENKSDMEHIKKKIDCMDRKMAGMTKDFSELKNVIIAMPCTEFNGKLTVNKEYHKKV